MLISTHNPQAASVHTLPSGSHVIELTDKAGRIDLFVMDDWSTWDALVSAGENYRQHAKAE